ncbi:MAG: ABC transporter substrate-binding protein [Chloroflexi bacterium]|nr:ABC transporter substrate-binding protein [Chloroflexota bacterium]
MRKWFGRALLAASLLVLVGCKPAAVTQQPAQTVTIAMGFTPNVQFTPFYVAIERGYFADEGIEVTLDYGMETDLLQEVGSGKLQFAATSGDQVILARSNGLPVRYVANWYRRFPVCVVSLAEEGITDPSMLAGKVVGIPVLQGASYIGWQAFIKESGLDPQEVTLQTIGYTQIASLTEKRVDAAVSYAMNEPVQLKTEGKAINVFYLDRFTTLVSNGLVTNDSTIESDPKLVAGVVRAFLRGLQDTLQDPDAAFQITRKAIPEMSDEAALLQRAVLDECLTFWKSDRLGENDPSAWQDSVDLLTELGMLSTPVDPETLYTNQFIPDK